MTRNRIRSHATTERQLVSHNNKKQVVVELLQDPRSSYLNASCQHITVLFSSGDRGQHEDRMQVFLTLNICWTTSVSLLLLSEPLKTVGIKP